MSDNSVAIVNDQTSNCKADFLAKNRTDNSVSKSP